MLLDIHDRGLHYGDGIFETIAVHAGRLHFWPLHYARLQRGGERLKIPVPAEQDLLKDIREVLLSEVLRPSPACGRGAGGEGVLKIILTRGMGGRGYTPPIPCTPNCILLIYPWPTPNPTPDLHLGMSSVRWSRQPLLAGIKHLNRLEQVLASQELQETGLREALMLDEAGLVISGIKSNLFMIKDKQLYTPDLTYSGIAGVIRQAILNLIPTCKIINVSLDFLLAADEVFICNSIMGVQPVKKIAETVFTQNKITHHIQSQLENVNHD